jgi:ADP-heptose:LPS heptosyltransferase
MLDPAPPLITSLVKRYRFLPRWLAGTAAAGLSGLYDRFCAASEGFRDLLVKNGAPAERVVVTGMPNYDDCQRFRDNRFPHHGYVLVCTSDARETKKRDDRQAFLRGVLAIAQGRPLIFKLHPNENVERATREIRQAAPSAMIVASGNVEEMIANCDEFITQYSSTAFVALALGKPVYSYYDAALLRRLLPDQNRSAAKNIASVCEEVLESEPAPKAVTEEPARSSSPPRR